MINDNAFFDFASYQGSDSASLIMDNSDHE